jgi:hypothetical protein
MAEEKQPLKYSESLIYVGKEFHRKFDNEDKTVTKSYKYMFKLTDESQFPNRFWGYDTTKGADALEEGERYVVAFVEKPNPKGDSPIKNARMFIKASEHKGTQNNNAAQGRVVPSEEVVKKFFEDYLGVEEDPTIKNFILTYFSTHYEEEYEVVEKVGRAGLE